MDKEYLGHAKMCVRMKLRKDQRDLVKRGEKLTLEQYDKVLQRINRGERTLAEIERGLSVARIRKPREDAEKQVCTHKAYKTYGRNGYPYSVDRGPFCPACDEVVEL
jgi:hypothetical protein